MKSQLLLACGLVALAAATPASAQHAGHQMQSPPPENQPTSDQPAHEHHDHSPSVSQPREPEQEHAGHGATDAGGVGHGGHGTITGALGRYPAGRESSGTAWQPDTAEHRGLTTSVGDWHLMGHADLFLVHSRQGSARGDEKTFGAGMVMGMARRRVGEGTLQLRAGFSPDPLMGRSGYPLLLASGETANGVDRLIDRQHPHDFVMELSASLSQPIGPRSSVFLYGGLPGEPAFGPGAFMHRESIMDSPEAPITHHWLDSQHISFGVVTGGLVLDRFKLEASRFNGREPDERRWNIETGPLDSTALRASWNPTPELALQVSWASLEEPEQLEPGVDQKRWSASGMYATTLGRGLRWASTMAWGRRTAEGHSYDAFATESSLKSGQWTFFGRGEITENNELVESEEGEGGHHGEAFRVGKVSAGVIRDFRIADQVKMGIGGLLSVNFVPEGLRSDYGKSHPLGGMAFVRLKVG